MSYCHECGSEVAPDDVYCPYCGISLQNAPDAALSSSTTVATPDDALPFEATQIDVPLESPVEPVRAGEEVVIEDVSLPAMPKEFDSGAQSVDSLLKSGTSENAAFETGETAGIGSHMPVGEQTPEAPAIIEETSEPARVETPAPLEIEDSEPEIEDVQQSDEPSFQSSPSMEEDEAVLEQPSAGEFAAGQFAPSPFGNQPTPDFDSTIPYTPADLAQQELIAAQLTENRPATVAPPETEPASSTANEIKPPATPLAGVDEEENLPATLISTPLPSFAEKTADAVEAASPSQAIAEPVAEKNDYQVSAPFEKVSEDSTGVSEEAKAGEARSNTSPNVNSVDTGGKKAKLKTLSEGTVLNGRYEIVRKIGGGGMGAVYLASDKNLGGVLRAVKEMVQSYIEEDAAGKSDQRFQARILAFDFARTSFDSDDLRLFLRREGRQILSRDEIYFGRRFGCAAAFRARRSD